MTHNVITLPPKGRERMVEQVLKFLLGAQRTPTPAASQGGAIAQPYEAPVKDGPPPSGYRKTPDGNLEIIPGGPADRKANPPPADQASGEMGMRKELSSQLKDARSILSMYQNVKSAANSGSAAGDLSLTLQAITVDGKGRVTGTKDATITGTTGQIAVANGNAASGLPTISLVDVPDAGGGTLQKTQFDAKGRKTGTSAATTDNLPEGSTNLYYTDTRADARATLAVDAHVAEADPHPQYATPAEAAAAAPVQSVNGQAGDVALGASDVGADEVGTAGSSPAVRHTC